MRFRDRAEAGAALASRVRAWLGGGDRAADVVVLALPRGGVPVGYAVARTLDAPLDIAAVHKIGAPEMPELALGAVASGGVRVLNQDVIDDLGVPPDVLEARTEQARRAMEGREAIWRRGLPPVEIAGRDVVLVDDGIATGATLRAALASARARGAARVLVAAPVAPPSACEALAAEADGCVCALTPRPFYGVGRWYKDFAPCSDAEVARLLALARTGPATPAAGEGDTPGAEGRR